MTTLKAEFQSYLTSLFAVSHLQSKNYIAFSNRAMAYLKLKEFHRAVVSAVLCLSLSLEVAT